MKGTYTVRVRCDNCGRVGVAEIPMGRKIHDTLCKDCGCKTLRKA